MAAVTGFIGGNVSSSWIQLKDRKKKKTQNRVRVGVSCSSSSSVMDPYKTLKVHRGATESEVKQAFRRLALQYHPDVCRGSSCGVNFQTINEAYETVMDQLRRSEEEEEEYETYGEGVYEEDLWEEWMGWEGAGIRDYTSHINPYI